MVRWLRWHCPPDTGFEIRALAVWGRARYLSVTEAPHNTNFHTWMGKKQFLFLSNRLLFVNVTHCVLCCPASAQYWSSVSCLLGIYDVDLAFSTTFSSYPGQWTWLWHTTHGYTCISLGHWPNVGLMLAPRHLAGSLTPENARPSAVPIQCWASAFCNTKKNNSSCLLEKQSSYCRLAWHGSLAYILGRRTH